MKNEIFSMEGKVVIFTGGAGWLGQPMTKALLDYGAKVAVIGRTDRLGEDFDEYRQSGQMIFISADMQKTEQIKTAFAQVKETYGKIDVLVNNAGGALKVVNKGCTILACY